MARDRPDLDRAAGVAAQRYPSNTAADKRELEAKVLTWVVGPVLLLLVVASLPGSLGDISGVRRCPVSRDTAADLPPRTASMAGPLRVPRNSRRRSGWLDRDRRLRKLAMGRSSGHVRICESRLPDRPLCICRLLLSEESSRIGGVLDRHRDWAPPSGRADGSCWYRSSSSFLIRCFGDPAG